MDRLMAKTNILGKKSQPLNEVTDVFYRSGLVTLHHEVLRLSFEVGIQMEREISTLTGTTLHSRRRNAASPLHATQCKQFNLARQLDCCVSDRSVLKIFHLNSSSTVKVRPNRKAAAEVMVYEIMELLQARKQ